MRAAHGAAGRAAAAALLLLPPGASGSDVLVADARNFKQVIQQDALVLMEFYAPWCGHCKKLAPEWERAATDLKGKAVLAKIDATEEAELAEKYEIEGYPTVKFWQDGSGPEDYEGGRSAQDIIAWVGKRTGPAVRALADAAALAKEKQSTRVFACLFAADDAPERKLYDAAAAKNRAHTWTVVASAEVAQEEGMTPPAVVVYKSFDDGKEQYPDAADTWADRLAPFVRAASFRLLDEVGPDNYKEYLARGIPMAWLFVDPSDEAATTTAKAAAELVAGELKGRLSFVWLSGVQYGQMAERVGLTARKWPAIGIDDNGEHYGLEETSSVTADVLRDWAQRFLDGKLDPTVKSEEVPTENPVDNLWTLVGSNFKEQVLDETKDVMVKFYAPWCGHCKAAIPAYAALAQQFENVSTVRIAKMDATANDPPREFEVRGYPTIMFVKGGTNEIIRYDGDRERDKMAQFIIDNAHTPVDPPAAGNGATAGADEL